MASSTLSTYSPNNYFLKHQSKSSTSSNRFKSSTTTFFLPPIKSSSVSNPPPSLSTSPQPPHTTTKLPIRKIPGDYGIPFITPYKERLDYFYNQGRDEYFKSRIQKYQSTIFRTNVPPGGFIAQNPNVIALLDAKSFPILFDTNKIDKTDVFTGTYTPSTELTGGYRVLSYLDPSDPKHTQLKNLMFFLLKSRRNHVIPEFRSCYKELFATLENELAKTGKASFADANDQSAFNFLSRSFFGVNPVDTELGLDGPKMIQKWVLFQLGPVLKLGLPKFVEDSMIHNFRLPFGLIKKDYKRLYDFFYNSSGFALDEAERLGVSREEACHNLLFATCFNSFGGFKLFFPNLMKWIGRGGVRLHTKLATEIREAVRSAGGEVTMAAMENMPLMKSLVYEAFRIDPPVPLQFGRAKRDMVIENHENGFLVKKGEMLLGYQPFATKDPKVFDKAEEFVADRFVGDDGEKLLKHLVWSNGPETESPSVRNKQCAGKDFTTLVSRLLVVELFLRYDSFEIQVGNSALGTSITLTSLKRASF